MKKPKWFHSWRKKLPSPTEQVSAPSGVPNCPDYPLVSFEGGRDLFKQEAEDIVRFREYVNKLQCPLCAHSTLDLVSYEKGKAGWEAAVTCNSCRLRGVLNNDGFRVAKPLLAEMNR